MVDLLVAKTLQGRSWHCPTSIDACFRAPDVASGGARVGKPTQIIYHISSSEMRLRKERFQRAEFEENAKLTASAMYLYM